MRCLDRADMVGNGVAETTLRTEMYHKRRKMHRPDYMRHFQEYLFGHTAYIQKYRRLRDSRSLVDIPTSVILMHNGYRARYGVRTKLPIAYVRPPSRIAPQPASYYHPCIAPLALSAPPTNAAIPAQSNAYVRGLNVSFGEI